MSFHDNPHGLPTIKQLNVFMEKYVQAGGNTSWDQKPESLLLSAETWSHLCHRAANISAISNKSKINTGLSR